jgi:hypothetical protein
MRNKACAKHEQTASKTNEKSTQAKLVKQTSNASFQRHAQSTINYRVQRAKLLKTNQRGQIASRAREHLQKRGGKRTLPPPQKKGEVAAVCGSCRAGRAGKKKGGTKKKTPSAAREGASRAGHGVAACYGSARAVICRVV